jgi:hypothetical protein
MARRNRSSHPSTDGRIEGDDRASPRISTSTKRLVSKALVIDSLDGRSLDDLIRAQQE